MRGPVAEIRDDGRIDMVLDPTLTRRMSRWLPDVKRPIRTDVPPVTDNEFDSPLPAYQEREYPIQPDHSGLMLVSELNNEAPPTFTYTTTTTTTTTTTAPTATAPLPRVFSPWAVRLNIVIQVVGSRGDVQPFIALGTELKRHGHRVRIATHDTFADFVRGSGDEDRLEFFPIGGDPKELMAYMVKNPGLIPNMNSLKGGDIQKKRRMVADILDGCWRSCVLPDPLTGAPFVADAIIANPPSFAGVHLSEALGIPVHMFFSMPWTATRAYPHPLANIKMSSSEEDSQVANYLSYSLVEWMTWQGLGDVINKWRKTLDLEPVPISEGPSLASTLEIPHTYFWSPSLVPKPADWPPHVDVCGFFFRDPPQYTPDPELANFLASGPPPVYIGFGSIVLSDPEKLNKIIVDAVDSLGVRAIISRGWSNLGGMATSDGPSAAAAPNILYIGDCPHEWLFQHVAAVVHHGGAGTTACGLRFGRPTMVVPFFGDQPFWGSMVATAGAGPKPITHTELTTENLAEGIRFCLSPEAATACKAMAHKINQESGVAQAVKSFHSNLPLERLKCDILENQPAVWAYKGKRGELNISKLAAEVLLNRMKVERSQLKPLKTKQIVIENQRWDIVTAFSSAGIGVLSDVTLSVYDMFAEPAKEYSRARKEQTALLEEPEDDDDDDDAASRITATTTTTTQGQGQSPLRSPSTASIPPSTPSTIQTGLSDPSSPSTSISAVSAASAASISAASTKSGSGSSSKNSSKKRSSKTKKYLVPVGAAAKGSALGVGSVINVSTRALLVDMPLATAEGLRQMPKLYGGEVRDYGPITDWKSGGAVAAKHFAYGMTEGIAGIVMDPIRGGREGGAWGAVKGFGKGIGGLITQTSSGIIAYPGQGIYKSIRSLAKSGTRATVMAARYGEGEYMLRSLPSGEWQVKTQRVLEVFDRLMKRGRGSG